MFTIDIFCHEMHYINNKWFVCVCCNYVTVIFASALVEDQGCMKCEAQVLEDITEISED